MKKVLKKPILIELDNLLTSLRKSKEELYYLYENVAKLFVENRDKKYSPEELLSKWDTIRDKISTLKTTDVIKEVNKPKTYVDKEHNFEYNLKKIFNFLQEFKGGQLPKTDTNLILYLESIMVIKYNQLTGSHDIYYSFDNFYNKIQTLLKREE